MDSEHGDTGCKGRNVNNLDLKLFSHDWIVSEKRIVLWISDYCSFVMGATAAACSAILSASISKAFHWLRAPLQFLISRQLLDHIMRVLTAPTLCNTHHHAWNQPLFFPSISGRLPPYSLNAYSRRTTQMGITSYIIMRYERLKDEPSRPMRNPKPRIYVDNASVVLTAHKTNSKDQ